MSIPHAAFGFLVASVLAFEAPSGSVSGPVDQAAMLQHTATVFLAEARNCRDAVLDATLDRVGETVALMKRI